MASMTAEQQQNVLDRDVRNSIRAALQADAGPVWNAIDSFVGWVRKEVKDFLFDTLSKLPVVGRWASRISVTVSEFGFTILSALLQFLKVLIMAPTFWTKAHETALHAWDDNAANGLAAQVYAYSKKMAGFFLEVVVQCLERAIRAHGLEMTPEERQDITNLLDDLLP